MTRTSLCAVRSMESSTTRCDLFSCFRVLGLRPCFCLCVPLKACVHACRLSYALLAAWDLHRHRCCCRWCFPASNYCHTTRQGEDQLLSIKALNEFDLKATDWRKKLESQRGAVLAFETKVRLPACPRMLVQMLWWCAGAGADAHVCLLPHCVRSGGVGERSQRP